MELAWKFVIVVLTASSVVLVTVLGQDDEKFSEDNFVNVRKIPLMRRKVSLKQKDIGPSANYSGACRLDIFAACRQPIYEASSKSIYERSDMLLELLTAIKNMWNTRPIMKPNATCWPNESFTYAEICGSNHFMACVPNPQTQNDKRYGCCECVGDNNASSTIFPQYANMTYSQIGLDPNPVPFPPRNQPNYRRNISECRQTQEDSLCNVKAFILCDLSMSCENDEDKEYRCRCKKLPAGAGNDSYEYIEEHPPNGMEPFKVPKNNCQPKPRYRAREWQ